MRQIVNITASTQKTPRTCSWDLQLRKEASGCQREQGTSPHLAANRLSTSTKEPSGKGINNTQDINYK